MNLPDIEAYLVSAVEDMHNAIDSITKASEIYRSFKPKEVRTTIYFGFLFKI